LPFANLTDANLSNTSLEVADLSEANLAGANLCGARLAMRAFQLLPATGLTQEQLESARGDKDTVLPEELRRPSEWTKR
jgi:uncharacterized protein YjbI with pentapeptide repeats